MLKTETNTAEMAERIGAAFDVHPHAADHEHTSVNYEHGQHWVTCSPCGAAWSVVDAIGGSAVDGFDFEEVAEGDGSCLEDSDEETSEETENEAPDAETLNDNATITDNPRGGYVLTIEGRVFGYYDDTDTARARFNDRCEREKFWPALYEINDHGNVTLIDPSTGAHLRGWV